MADKDISFNDARARLAKSEPRTRRLGSIAAKVEELQPEILAARRVGKTWLQIAAAISDQKPLNADAVRVALARSCKVVIQERTSSRKISRAPSPLPSKPKSLGATNEPLTKDNGILDMFGPMFDARDTRGRGPQSNLPEETSS